MKRVASHPVIHCLSAGEATEEARALLNESNEGIEFVAQASLQDSEYTNDDVLMLEKEAGLAEQVLENNIIDIFSA